MNIIKTMEELQKVVTQGGLVTQGNDMSCALALSDTEKVTVSGGIVDMRGVIIQGMSIQFKKCEIVTHEKGEFRGCRLGFEYCQVHPLTITTSDTYFLGGLAGGMHVNGGDLQLDGDVSMMACVLNPSRLISSPKEVLHVHMDGYNSVRPKVRVTASTTSVSNFGERSASAHYFKEQGKVILGRWQGELEEFREEAEKQGVPEGRYEAVYNYFKTFN